MSEVLTPTDEHANNKALALVGADGRAEDRFLWSGISAHHLGGCSRSSSGAKA
jgi:hypothetical protein